MKSIMKQKFVWAALGAAVLLSVSQGAAAQSYKAKETYANPEPETTASARRRGPCNDPWVTIALERVYGQADPANCAVGLYNGGQWSDFNQLVHAVAATRQQFMVDRVNLRVVPGPSGKSYIAIFQNGRMVAAGGGNMVAAGGGNLIGMDGASLIGNDAGSLVAAGGGNALPSATIGNGRQLLSGRSIRLPVGGLVIK